MKLEELSKDELITLVQMYAKNWLAIDGTWFQALEKKFGMETAIKMDIKSWERFTIIEANRIKKEFELEEGLAGLKTALSKRVYAVLNEDEIEEISEQKIIYKMKSCRVQAARERRALPLFPCKQVGIVEYSGFASTIDPRIKTKCIAAPPDKLKRDFHCAWEFTITE